MNFNPYIELLRDMIAIPSPSGEEDAVACLVCRFLSEYGIESSRVGNNVVARNSGWKYGLPVVMLNSHLDTVKPAASYTRNPYSPDIKGERLYGLGSNDAGASVVSLIAVFIHFYNKELPFNLMLVLSAEEERSGVNGLRAAMPHIGEIDMAIVGEPTGMKAAVGERGLLVLDGVAEGVSGHAARNEGVNALYKALDDIAVLRNFRFERESELLGPIKVSVTQIDAGTQHNVIPDICRFVVDVRTTDAYSNPETVKLLQRAIGSRLTPRSTHLQASAISSEHPLVKAALENGCETFVSPTMSDMALMDFPSLKIGPGDSARSHTADEYVLVSEIENAIPMYQSIIESLKNIYIKYHLNGEQTLG